MGDWSSLGKWLKKQRQQRQDGALRKDREAKLQELADRGLFRWSTTVPKVHENDEKKWQANYEMLVAYSHQNGGGTGSCDIHTKTSIATSETGPSAFSRHLGLWLKRQKRQKHMGMLR